MALQPGTRLGPYDILAPVGKGGMGEVYRARDTRLDRDVAIKVSSTEFSERFAREARSIAALNHTNICHLYDVGPNYLVLEYIEGQNLIGPMSWDEALPIIRQLIDGIEAAHEKNIIHRDLKTANIRITPDGAVKILDFGLAKAAEPESMADPALSPTFTMGATQAGVILGTAAYMPPEQAKGKAADRRSDIWSFGVVVYELLVGRTPFEADNTVEILGAVINKEPDWSRVPVQAQRLLRWCLEKDRRKRLAAISDARMLLEDNGPPGTPVLLLEKTSNARPSSIRADGRLVYSQAGAQVLPDIWTLPIDLTDPDRPKPGKPDLFLGEPTVEVDPAFSPDGGFIAYSSTELGPSDVFVRPFPGPGGTWKISPDGGKFPAWSRATRELFYLGADDRIMVVPYTIEGDSFIAGASRVWSPTQVRRDGVRQSFDVSPDGTRIVMLSRPAEAAQEGPLHATFLLNFFDEVRRRIP